MRMHTRMHMDTVSTKTRTENVYGNPRPEQYPDAKVDFQAHTSRCDVPRGQTGPLVSLYCKFLILSRK